MKNIIAEEETGIEQGFSKYGDVAKEYEEKTRQIDEEAKKIDEQSRLRKLRLYELKKKLAK